MAASIITRTSWTDDDGSGTTGTIINNAQLQAVYDAIDQLFSGAGSYTTTTFGGNVRLEGTTGLKLKGIATGSLVASAAGDAAIAYDSTQKQLVSSIDGNGFGPLGTFLPANPFIFSGWFE